MCVYIETASVPFSLIPYLSSLHWSLGKEKIPQSTTLTFFSVVAFLRSTNCGLVLSNAQTFLPFSGAGRGIDSSWDALHNLEQNV